MSCGTRWPAPVAIEAPLRDRQCRIRAAASKATRRPADLSRALTAAEVEILARQRAGARILAMPAGKRSKEQKARLRDYFLLDDAPPEYQPRMRRVEAR